MQQYYVHGVPKDRRSTKAVDSLQQQLCRQQQNSTENLNVEPVLLIVLRRGKYQEEVLQQTAIHVQGRHKIIFGDIPNKLTEGGIYCRQHLLDMRAHLYVHTDIRILVSIH